MKTKLNFIILHLMHIRYEANIHKLASNELEVQNKKLINVCFSLNAQRLMVKTTQKSDLLWSAIFHLIMIPWKRKLTTKVVQIIKCTCTAFIEKKTSEIFQLTHRYRYQFVEEVMTDM